MPGFMTGNQRQCMLVLVKSFRRTENDSQNGTHYVGHFNLLSPIKPRIYTGFVNYHLKLSTTSLAEQAGDSSSIHSCHIFVLHHIVSDNVLGIFSGRTLQLQHVIESTSPH